MLGILFHRSIVHDENVLQNLTLVTTRPDFKILFDIDFLRTFAVSHRGFYRFTELLRPVRKALSPSGKSYLTVNSLNLSYFLRVREK